jgi:hypothetical protein
VGLSIEEVTKIPFGGVVSAIILGVLPFANLTAVAETKTYVLCDKATQIFIISAEIAIGNDVMDENNFGS